MKDAESELEDDACFDKYAERTSTWMAVLDLSATDFAEIQWWRDLTKKADTLGESADSLQSFIGALKER